MSDKDRKAPTVFISSTNIDLEDYRKEAAMAAHAVGIHADLQKNWTAEDHPLLDACLERVRKADVLVAIIGLQWALRSGWFEFGFWFDPAPRFVQRERPGRPGHAICSLAIAFTRSEQRLDRVAICAETARHLALMLEVFTRLIRSDGLGRNPRRRARSLSG